MPVALVALALGLWGQTGAAGGAAGGTAGGAVAGPTLAILELQNAGMDPRVDYLSGIVQGILAYDLGGAGGITLVDRRNLDTLLKEKELSLSALGQDSQAAAEAGKILGADWMLSGDYVFTGTDVLITISLTDTASARRVVFRDRGATENVVHRLAEQIVLRLTGAAVHLADDSRARSLVSLRDETPGSIALFSIIIDAEIYLDGTFVGYTTGDGHMPYILDKVIPGLHTLRTHLDSSFGVVKLPEVTFGDWQVQVQVEPGQRLVVRDETRQFNEILYRLQNIYSETLSAPADNLAALAVSKELSFQDRKGRTVSVRLESLPRPLPGGGVAVDLTLSASAPTDSRATASLSRSGAEDQGSVEQKVSAGLVDLSATLDRRGDSWELELWIQRNDIHQNMFRE